MMPNECLAKQAAALEACKEPHKLGEFDEKDNYLRSVNQSAIAAALREINERYPNNTSNKKLQL